MQIKNLEKAVFEIKSHLATYLESQGISVPHGRKPFKCFMHDDNSPSAYYLDDGPTPIIYCQACKGKASTIDAYSIIEGKSVEGSGFTDAVLELGDRLGVFVEVGEISAVDRAKYTNLQLISDIADLLDPNSEFCQDYIDSRNWFNDKKEIRFTYGSLDVQKGRQGLLEKGWESEVVYANTRKGGFFPKMPPGNDFRYFDAEGATFVIRSYTGAPIAFCTRLKEPDSEGRKWVNTHNVPGVFSKKSALYGIDIAYKYARRQGLILVEGLGEVLQMHRLGIYNVVALGTANITKEQLTAIKKLGIKKICLALDWDDAGYKGTRSAIKEFAGQGIQISVLKAPDGIEAKDLDEYLMDAGDASTFTELKKVSAFQWWLEQFAPDVEAETILDEMIPVIAAEPRETRRELMGRDLSERTGVSEYSISREVLAIVNAVVDEKNGRLIASTEEYKRNILTDPANASTHLMQHTADIERIEKEYKQSNVGADYQLEKLDAIEERAARLIEQGSTGFVMHAWPEFVDMLDGGNWAEGVIIGIGGHPHHGKSVLIQQILADVCLHDEEAIVIAHFTDDTVSQVAPMIKGAIANHTKYPDEPWLTLQEYQFPTTIRDSRKRAEYERANSLFRGLIKQERLILLDRVEGVSLNTLLEQIEYVRRRQPNKKLLILQDNSYNSAGANHAYKEKKDKIIAHFDALQDIVGKYNCTVAATMEYTKFADVDDFGNLVWPDDDKFKDAVEVQYRPHVLMHVVNDMKARKAQGAKIFWRDEHDQKQPKIAIKVTKNKVTARYPDLYLCLDTKHKVSVAESLHDQYLEDQLAARAAAYETTNQEEYDYNPGVAVNVE